MSKKGRHVVSHDNPHRHRDARKNEIKQRQRLIAAKKRKAAEAQKRNRESILRRVRDTALPKGRGIRRVFAIFSF